MTWLSLETKSFLTCSNSMIKIYSLNDVNDDKLNQFNDYICDRIR